MDDSRQEGIVAGRGLPAGRCVRGSLHRISPRMLTGQAGARQEMIDYLRLGIADHLRWAIARDGDRAPPGRGPPADRNRSNPAPVEHEAQRLAVAAAAALATKVRASAERAYSAARADIANALPAPIVSISLRAWPPDFPTDIAVHRAAPYQARANAIMYRQALSEFAHARGWEVHLYDAKAVEDQALRMLAQQAGQILQSPREAIGPRVTRYRTR
jgi:hypothetical protein